MTYNRVIIGKTCQLILHILLYVAIPQFRNASLARFLEKRKERSVVRHEFFFQWFSAKDAFIILVLSAVLKLLLIV